MKLVIEKDTQAMSENAMYILLGAMLQDKRVNISLTSGRTPKTMYEMMIPLIRDQKKFKDVEFYLFDENPFIGEKYGTNWAEMKEMFFEPAHIPEERIHRISLDNWQTYDWEIRQAGGLDVMVIGLGHDGHFCGNCPRCTQFDSYTYCMEYKDKLAANPNYGERPRQPYTITMGAKSLMRVRHLVMIVDGQEKAEIFKRFIEEPINEEVPATILKLHPNLTAICDEAAASFISVDDYSRL